MTLIQQSIIADVGKILENSTQREKLDCATWIILSCLSDTQPGMTEADHYLDVLTRCIGDITVNARGRLGRYGNKGVPKK